MKFRISSIAAIAALLTSMLPGVVRSEDKPVHLFILSGQSNMAGMNPKAGFEQEAAKLFPGAEVPYIKVARGGQPIRYWVTEWDDIAARQGIDVDQARAKDKGKGTLFYQPILDQAGALLEKYPDPDSVTFCWMQGERDAKEKLAAAYGDALKQLVANLRRDLKQPEMNVVIARLSDFGKPENKEWENIRKAQAALAKSDPHGAWVDCDDLNDKEKNGAKIDDLHYTKEGYQLLGQRYVRQAMSLIEGKEPAESGRPE